MAPTSCRMKMGFAATAAVLSTALLAAEIRSTAEVLTQPSMNVFRRFEVPAEKMFEFYGPVLGFEQLGTFDVGGGTGVARFQAGGQELKMTRQVPERSYEKGGVKAATGLRLLTFFFKDEQALADRFAAHGRARPEFKTLGDGKRAAVVDDPDGQPVELVIVPNASEEDLKRIEIGLTVSDLEESRAFYRDFVGIEELPPAADPLFDTTVYGFRSGYTTIELRHFGSSLPADSGSGGIQYVVSDVEAVNDLATKHEVHVQQPLSTLQGFGLRTVWLGDPDNITNYFAQTGQRTSAVPSPAQ